MPVKKNKESDLIQFIRERGIIRTSDAIAGGFVPVQLSRLVKKGVIARISRGLYELASPNRLSEHHSFAEAAKAVPGGVICLLSALAFYGLGTQVPHQVWLAIDRKREKPRVTYPPIRFVWLSPRFLKSGVIIHEVDGINVPMTTPARTVADCFKFRNQVGLDVALEALRAGLRERRFTRTELAEQAAKCRVWTVLRPYLEAVSA